MTNDKLQYGLALPTPSCENRMGDEIARGHVADKRFMADSTPEPTETTTIIEVDLTGRRLGDYHILRRLGRGGMADVYLAEQASLSRRVAFKVLKSSLAENEKYVRRFLHEAQAAASLVHGNIVQIYEVGCIDGVHFIAQEYVEGQNLKQLIDRQGTLSVAAAVNIMRQVAAALHKAGQQKITHRDIKPENVMLSVGGEVKVADFGLARIVRDGQSVNLTQVGVTMGTPLYMSPEQVKGRAVDTRSDIYSFGVTCYQMLAGRLPFEGETPLNIAVQHLNSEPDRLEDLRQDLPSGLGRIVHRMMAKRAEDRYQTAGDLLRDLRGLQAEGLDVDWSAGTEEWTTPEQMAMADARAAATQQLSAIMRNESSAGRSRWSLALWTSGGVFVAFLLGLLAAWATRPAPLLAVSPEDVPEVERQPTVQDQYFQATMLRTEDAWMSLNRYFPAEKSEQNRYYAYRAKQRLAELYLNGGDLDQAMRLYTELATAAQAELRFRAFGLVGQITVHRRRDETELAREKEKQLGEIMKNESPQFHSLLFRELAPGLRQLRTGYSGPRPQPERKESGRNQNPP